MRSGYHPLKKKGTLEPPPDVTVCMVTFIPFLSGYFEQSLDVLRLSLESLWRTTPPPYDLMIFDNGSCAEARRYLLEQQEAGKIQYLFLSDQNVGLPGAWNALFRAAPGKVIAYSDSDVYFYPGWLEAHLRALEAYPQAGMITGTPFRARPELVTRTIEWAGCTAGVKVTRGQLQDWDTFWTHARSLGLAEAEGRQQYDKGEDILVEYQGVPAYVGASHFQYVSPRAALNAVAPFPYVMPMGNELYLDEQMNALGYLRLSLTKIYVRHMGNRLSPEFMQEGGSKVQADRGRRSKAWDRILDFYPVKKIMMFIYTKIFHWYYVRK